MNYARLTPVLSWLADRLQEKSTYVGLTLLLSALGFTVSDAVVNHYQTIVMTFGGLLAVIVKDS